MDGCKKRVSFKSLRFTVEESALPAYCTLPFDWLLCFTSPLGDRFIEADITGMDLYQLDPSARLNKHYRRENLRIL